MNCHIGYNRQASNTPAFALIAEGWNELVQESLTPDMQGVCPVSASSQVLYALGPDGDAVGVLTWEHHKDQATFEVTLAYVEPSSRKQGVFTALYLALFEMAKKSGVSAIHFQLHPSNKPAATVLGKLHGRVSSVLYEHAVV
jgi:GNAT superfamily N-acetyltransferase